MKTPRHSYHQRRSLLGNVLNRGAAHEDEEQLPIVDSIASEKVSSSSSSSSNHGHNIKIAMYGMLNTVILIPVMISFAQIIFRDPAFQPYMTDLVKLVLVSAAVHQLCFTLTSSLSFAIGQVQDAGLIFLSAMATSTVQSLREFEGATFSMEEVLSTVLFTLAGSTALLGIALIITGKLKIASFVQYLPMPVVGGYLAYIGFYCLEAGLSMMSGKTIKDPSDWVQLANTESLLLVLPGVLAGIGIFAVLTRCDHVAVLPGCMLAILCVFYGILLIFGISLKEASAAGWVSPPPEAPRSIIDIYGFYDFKLANFSFVSKLVPAWIAMYFVVAFSSSLDVAAIEMALGTPLDHNHELQTVGISNFVSGITGGFTGSYIFSQTIFTLRGNLDSRINGVLVFFLEIAIVLCPFSIIAYVPKVFFGALQTLIAADLMMEWMWHARHKMLFREFAIVWFTFIVMNVYSLDVGIVLGITIAGFNFIWSYIAVSSVRRVVKRSRVERDLRERELLQTARLSIVTLELDGFIFFGSSVKMMEEVRRHVLVSTSEAAAAHAASQAIQSSPLQTFRHSRIADEAESLVHKHPVHHNGAAASIDIDDNEYEELTTLDEHNEFHVSNQSDSSPRIMRAM
uniref:SLC26A/SulP transporter domain-containing protein n=1 Tax=Globisporangium ultimum (strain ATCC 200006 / CBS 805.95 / DAOM BR144) TaxID=431595 RepID=K3W503_GLOUD